MRNFISFFLASFFTISAFAADTVQVHYLGIEQGLSNNAVTSILKDHKGFLWIATYDGLNKYDGSVFTIFRNKIGDTTSLMGNQVYCLADDRQYNIWVGGQNGACVYHPLKNIFSPLYITNANTGVIKKLSSSVSAITSGKSVVYIAVNHSGLFAFSSDKSTGVQIPLQINQTISYNYNVTALKNSVTNELWLFVEDIGLCKLDEKQNRIIVVNKEMKRGNCLLFDKEDNIWMGNDVGLYRYTYANNHFEGSFINGNYKIPTISIDKKGILWIATDGKGVFKLDTRTNKVKPLLRADGSEVLNSSAVFAIYQDAEEREWIGTLRGGVNVIEPKANPFQSVSFHEKNNPNINFIRSFCEDQNGNLWIGTSGAGLRFWNRTSNTYTLYTHDPNNSSSLGSDFVTSIVKDTFNTIWLSTWYGGVNRFGPSAGTFRHYACFNPYTNEEEKQVWFLYEDRFKTLWASTSNDGTLYTLNRKTDRFDIFDNRLVNMQCLEEDSKGDLWGGNYSSLVKVDRKTKRHITYFIGFTVRCIHEDKFGNFWIGTQGGGLLLFNRSNGTYRRFDEAAGLQGNTILRILEDKQGNLWMSSFTGLIKYDAREKIFRLFSQSDGLQSNQFSFNAAIAMRSGEFIFGGIKGFNFFDPTQVYEQDSKPNVYLTGITIAGEPLEANSSYITKSNDDNILEITVPFNKASLAFSFVAPEFTSPDKLRYSYVLDGWDRNQSITQNIRTANYSRLSEGTYYFKVRVTDIWGVWGKQVQLLKITVLPPWYRSWWAYLMYIGLLASLVYTYGHYKNNQNRLHYQVKLAQLTAEKEKELTEKKIAFFTHISHEFRTPLTLIINPLKEIIFGKNQPGEEKSLGVVYRNAKRLLSLVDQLLLFRKVEAEEPQMRIEVFAINVVCNEVYLAFEQHAKAKNISFFIEIPETDLFVFADKEKIEIILFNLLSNAFKFTPNGGSISVKVGLKEKDVCITVTDTGCGISEDAAPRLFKPFYQADIKDSNHPTGFGIGLYLSKRLAEANHGKLYFTSETGKGTSFTLSLPSHEETVDQHSHLSSSDKAPSSFLQELIEDVTLEKTFPADAPVVHNKSEIIDKLVSDLPLMLIVDDNADMRMLLRQVFEHEYNLLEAEDGEDGFQLALKEVPDIIISDIMMNRMSGIELCATIKATPSIGHIPVILLTASSSADNKLKGIEGGADDYIMKPFDKDIIMASVKNILKRRTRLQQYFFNAVTLQPNFNIAGEYKDFIEQCIAITEKYLDDPDFNIKTFSREIGMSHPKLYKKVKAVSGLSVNVFIRYLRLRKAAELLINTDKTISEVTYEVGFRDIKYFREQFNKLFEMNPSEYVKRYRKSLGSKI
ncbi:MAG: response regulator [Bacteroidota bacterium]|nr:response regulator [Bacteroidota bacterium]